MIASEINKLTHVLVHKPIFALKHLTPNNCREFLFDDVVWVERANEEHDLFELLLQDNGVKVYLLHRMLFDILQIPEARFWLLEKRLSSLRYHSALKTELLNWLVEQPVDHLGYYLLAGLPLKDCILSQTRLVTDLMKPHDFLLTPLPNHLFTRDSSCWIGQGIVISAMKFHSRRAESLNMAAIYKFHPLFVDQKIHIWYDGAENDTLPSLEGGDVMVINEDILLIGISERTSAEAVELLGKNLFTEQQKKEIIVLELPKKRAFMHLDVMMTMVSQDTFVTAVGQNPLLRSWRLRPGDSPGEVIVEPLENYIKFLEKILGISELRFVQPAGDYYAARREQWSDSANVLVIAPGEVIAYDRNVEMNRKLRAAGILVHEIPGSELSRGRGGPRCMTCPLERKVS